MGVERPPVFRRLWRRGDPEAMAAAFPRLDCFASLAMTATSGLTVRQRYFRRRRLAPVLRAEGVVFGQWVDVRFRRWSRLGFSFGGVGHGLDPLHSSHADGL